MKKTIEVLFAIVLIGMSSGCNAPQTQDTDVVSSTPSCTIDVTEAHSAVPTIDPGTSINEIVELEQIIKCYEGCLNNTYCLQVDDTKQLADIFDEKKEKWEPLGAKLYLVTSPIHTITDLESYILKYMTKELFDTLTEDDFALDDFVQEFEGELYLRCGLGKGHVSFQPEEAKFIKVDDNGSYVISVPMYNSGGNYCSDEIFIIKKITGTFKLIEVISSYS